MQAELTRLASLRAAALLPSYFLPTTCYRPRIMSSQSKLPHKDHSRRSIFTSLSSPSSSPTGRAPNNLAHINRDRGYRFIKQDPILRDVSRAITESGLSLARIASKSGVTTCTISRWMSGKVKRPQNLTVEFVLKALGYKRVLIKIKLSN